MHMFVYHIFMCHVPRIHDIPADACFVWVCVSVNTYTYE